MNHILVLVALVLYLLVFLFSNFSFFSFLLISFYTFLISILPSFSTIYSYFGYTLAFKALRTVLFFYRLIKKLTSLSLLTLLFEYNIFKYKLVIFSFILVSSIFILLTSLFLVFLIWKLSCFLPLSSQSLLVTLNLFYPDTTFELLPHVSCPVYYDCDTLSLTDKDLDSLSSALIAALFSSIDKTLTSLTPSFFLRDSPDGDHQVPQSTPRSPSPTGPEHDQVLPQTPSSTPSSVDNRDSNRTSERFYSVISPTDFSRTPSSRPQTLSSFVSDNEVPVSDYSSIDLASTFLNELFKHF